MPFPAIKLFNKFSYHFLLLRGTYVPFFKLDWSEQDEKCVFSCLEGKVLPNCDKRINEIISGMVGDDYAVKLVNLGRSAIYLALQAMDLPAGSQVLLPSFSCAGVIAPVIKAGLKPVFVDVDDDFNVSFESLAADCNQKTRVVILPHLSGCWNDSTLKILDWAKARDIYVIEDATQSLGLMKNKKMAGTFGDVGVFSCHGGKNIFAPGGGWLITKHPSLKEKIKKIDLPLEPAASVNRRLLSFVEKYRGGNRELGRRIIFNAIKRKVFSTSMANNGFNFDFGVYSMSAVESLLILSGLLKLEKIVEKQIANACDFIEILQTTKSRDVILPSSKDNVFCKMLLSFYGYESCCYWFNCLSAAGVELEPSYVPLHLRSPFEGVENYGLAKTESKWRYAFCLPVRHTLTEKEKSRLIGALKRGVNGRGCS